MPSKRLGRFTLRAFQHRRDWYITPAINVVPSREEVEVGFSFLAFSCSVAVRIGPPRNDWAADIHERRPAAPEVAYDPGRDRGFLEGAIWACMEVLRPDVDDRSLVAYRIKRQKEGQLNALRQVHAAAGIEDGGTSR